MKATRVVPVFHVSDVDKAVAFYTGILGFKQTFRYGTYVGLMWGGAELHLTLPGDYQRSVGGGNAYFIGESVDDYAATIKAAGASLRSEPADRMYGMRDFVVNDPDGNQLSFGCDLDE